MRNFNSRSKSNRIVSLATLASVCMTIPFMCSKTDANAIGGVISRSLSRASSMAGSILNVSSRGAATLVSSGTRKVSAITNGSGDGSRLPSTSGTSLNLQHLNQRLTALENGISLENQRNSHPFNKVVVGSGLVASAAMVAGIVGGIVQQSKFTQLTKEQAETDQKVQEDITNMRNYFQKKEVPEAEQFIIDYYKENYGIDITKS